jgi:DNA mismatch endonuclease (patch repair protein)
MARIRSKDSSAELKLRCLVHGLGYRYRLHDRGLPGTPDMVFRSRRALIFMHGCFWHRHKNCGMARLPKSRIEFWTAKLEANRLRDMRTRRLLNKLGWRVLVIWECQLKDLDRVAAKVRTFLDKE